MEETKEARRGTLDWILDQKQDVSGKIGEILIRFVFSFVVLHQGQFPSFEAFSVVLSSSVRCEHERTLGEGWGTSRAICATLL